MIQKRGDTKTEELYASFLNSISHELRTPLTTILGCTDNLQSNATRLSENDKKELLHEISIASLRLNRQVENLLNIARLENGIARLHLDWCDINDLVYQAIDRLEPEMLSHNIKIVVPDDFPLVKLDVRMIEEVLYHLILNAVQHTPAETSILVQAGYERDCLKLIIADTGGGIPENEIQFVFDKFYRTKNSGTGGTGIGLTIVKGFVEAHRGTVTLENIPGRGATFTAEIPSHKLNIDTTS